jgi:tetraprenyl-beta-curcumene synthase
MARKHLLWCSVVYWTRLAPLARRELKAWRSRARAIPDPPLRDAAVGKLAREHLNAEAAAFFANLAEDQPGVVRRIVAFEVIYELLDTLTEGLALEDALRAHDALYEGADPYTALLADTWRPTQPSPVLLATVRRVVEAQSRNHAPDGELQRWAQAQNTGLLWWETAAARISCMGVHALLATPEGSHQATIDGYLQIDALASLLDALRDLPHDLIDGNHNFLAHYAGPSEAADRLVEITRNGARAVQGLPDAGVHRMVLAGLVAYNLSAFPPGPLATRLMRALPLIRVGVFAMRIRRAGGLCGKHLAGVVR